MIAVPHVERKRPLRLRGKIVVREIGRDEEPVWMRAHIRAVHPRLRVVHELRHRQVVEHRGERVEIALEPQLGRPAVERDAALGRRVALGHPFGLLDPQAVEEASEPRRRSFADTDDADHGRLEDRDLDAVPDQRIRQDHRGHPPGRSSADDDDLPDGGRDACRFIGLLDRIRIVEKSGGRRSIVRCGHGSSRICLVKAAAPSGPSSIAMAGLAENVLQRLNQPSVQIKIGAVAMATPFAAARESSGRTGSGLLTRSARCGSIVGACLRSTP